MKNSKKRQEDMAWNSVFQLVRVRTMFNLLYEEEVRKELAAMYPKLWVCVAYFILRILSGGVTV